MAQATPETRPEAEIAGYRDVLARIYTGQVSLPLTTDLILALHADLYTYVPGQGGSENNKIISLPKSSYPTNGMPVNVTAYAGGGDLPVKPTMKSAVERWGSWLLR